MILIWKKRFVRAINLYFDLEYEFYFWRTSNGVEVDFVLYGPRGFKIFELKHNDKIRPQDLKGLEAFKRDYPKAEAFLLFNGDRTEYHGEITALPLKEAIPGMRELLQ